MFRIRDDGVVVVVKSDRPGRGCGIETREGQRGMELQPHASERFYVSGACFRRWRPTTEHMGHVQQMTPVGMVGGGVGGGPGPGSGASESKFMVDDSVLTDLLDGLDPLSEHLLGEAWMGSGNTSSHPTGSFMAYSSGAPMFPTTSHTQHSYGANASMGGASLQAFPQEYAFQQALDSSQQSTLGTSLPMSSGAPTSGASSFGAGPQSIRTMSTVTTPGVGVGVGTNMVLSTSNLGAPPGIVMQQPAAAAAAAAAANRGGFTKPSSGALELGNVIGDGGHGDDEKSSLSTVEGKPVSSGNCEAGGMRRATVRGPGANALSLQDRILQALRFVARSRTDVLMQTWMPVMQGNRRFLLTREQPYVLEPHKNDQLWFYRTVSETYEFPTEKTEGNVLGLPGRVFSLQQPEWTPNVQFYTSLEYLRVKEAQRCDIRGSLAVPVLDQVTRQCLAVIELVGRAEKVQYGPDVDIIARALQVCMFSTPCCDSFGKLLYPIEMITVYSIHTECGLVSSHEFL